MRYEVTVVTPDPGELNMLRAMRESSVVRRPTGARPHEFVYYCDSREILQEFVDRFWRGRGGARIRARAEEADRASAVRVLAEYWVAVATNLAEEDQEDPDPYDVMEALRDLLRDWSPEDAILAAAAEILGTD